MLLGDEFIEFHPIFGKRLTPGRKRTLAHPQWGVYFIQANNEGFRSNRDFYANKPKGYRRILLYGDSNAFGDGVSYEVGFADVLKNLIAKCEVYNFAIPGFAVDQQYLCYQEIGAKYEHDLIVIAPTIETIRKLPARFVLNLDKQNIQRCIAKPYFDFENGKLVCGHVPLSEEYIDMEKLSPADKGKVYRANPFADVRKLLENTRPIGSPPRKIHLVDRLNAILKKLRLKNAIPKIQPYPEYDHPNTTAWKIMRAILAEWATNSPKQILVVPIPSFIYVKERASANNYQARFREIEKETNCLLFDPLPEMLKLSMEERRKLYYLEGHLTPIGHTWLAHQIAPRVLEAFKNIQ